MIIKDFCNLRNKTLNTLSVILQKLHKHYLYSRVLGFGSAVLEGFVWFIDPIVPPALNTGHLHLHVQTLPTSSCCSSSSSSFWFTSTFSRGQLLEMRSLSWTVVATNTVYANINMNKCDKYEIKSSVNYKR